MGELLGAVFLVTVLWPRLPKLWSGDGKRTWNIISQTLLLKVGASQRKVLMPEGEVPLKHVSLGSTPWVQSHLMSGTSEMTIR